MRWTVSAVGLLVVLAIPACRERSTSSVAVQVAVGNGHACAAFADGSARCWGEWRDGQRGDGFTLRAVPKEWLSSRNLRPKTAAMAVPNQVIKLTDAVEIAAGDRHTCARRKDGTVWCWGPAGQSGSNIEESPNHLVPYPVVVGITDAVQLAAGSSFTCARRSDGSIWCWGGLDRSLFKSRTTGYLPQAVSGVGGAVDIGAGGSLACALLASGSAMCWGRNGEGQVGDGTARNLSFMTEPTALPRGDVTAFSLGTAHICFVSSAGKVSCRGARVPKGLALETLAAGIRNTCGLTKEGALSCWGHSSFIERILPTNQKPAENDAATKIGTFPGAQQLVLGEAHACLRLESGAVKCLGYSWRGDSDASGPFSVDGLGKAIHLAAGSLNTCAVVEGGSVRCWGKEKKLEPVEGVSDATQVCQGASHGCALRTNGTVTCWGSGDRGQLGRGLTERGEKQPAKTVPGLGAVEQLAASSLATCARLKGGLVRCWGDNQEGQLGQGFFSSGGPKSAIGQPVTVRLPSPAVDLQGRAKTFCAKLTDGAIACWGSNDGDLIVDRKSDSNSRPPTPVNGVKDGAQIAVAKEHACVRTKGGKVFCWGSNKDGQMGDGTWGRGNLRATPVEIPALAGATEVLVSHEVTCGRMAGGRLTCVGGGGGMLWELPGLQPASQIALSKSANSRIYSGHGEPDQPSGCAVMNNGALACWGESTPSAVDKRPEMGPPVQVRW